MTTAISDVSEFPSSLTKLQRTEPPRRPIRPRVVLDSGSITSSDPGLRGRRLFWLEATNEIGETSVVADSFSLRDLQWLALQYQRAGWLVVDRTTGGAQ
ncbi:hypothetical protein [Xanthobacter autotrophicus]|uniref:hypothetical protein n=1 Tax=Xanthobacter autotrophicus TaxID=280 RepID=UPI003728A5BE